MVDVTDDQEELIDALDESSQIIMRSLIEHAHERDGKIVACCDTEQTLIRRIRRDAGRTVDRNVVCRCKKKLVTSGLIKLMVKPTKTVLAEYELFPREDEMTTNGGSTIAGNKYDGVLKSMGPGSFEGTCRLGNGKYDRKKFKVQDPGLAQKMWERWCEEVRQNKELTNPRKPESIVAETPACETVNTVSDADDLHVDTVEMPGKVYCIMTKGGEPLRFTKTLDAAIAAADMLSAALKAAGADIVYDVVEVGQWEW